MPVESPPPPIEEKIEIVQAPAVEVEASGGSAPAPSVNEACACACVVESTVTIPRGQPPTVRSELPESTGLFEEEQPNTSRGTRRKSRTRTITRSILLQLGRNLDRRVAVLGGAL